MKVSRAITEYKDYIDATKSKGTYTYYEYYLRVLDEMLGDLKCEEITNKIIVSFIQSQKERNPEISNATLNKFIASLKSMLSYTCIITIKFSKLKEKKKIIPTVSEGPIKKIFNFYEENLNDKNSFRNYLYLKLLLDTGLRMKELRNIKFKNIDFKTNCIHVKITKADVERYVCFRKSTSKLLKRFIKENNIQSYIFFDFNTKEKMTTSSVECFIYRLKKKLKITESITPHKWRHTFATNFIKNAGDLETLRLLLGHSNLKTTQKYLHLSKNDILKNYKLTMA